MLVPVIGAGITRSALEELLPHFGTDDQIPIAKGCVDLWCNRQLAPVSHEDAQLGRTDCWDILDLVEF